jgi:hypothetical protein
LSPFQIAMLGVFSFTLFTSATLLFLVQPMIGKMILPLLGGTPAVWNTCMVFFQALLLAGYGYAHISTTLLGVRKQAIVHMGVMLIPILFFPIGINRTFLEGSELNPIPGLLMLLFTSVGIPFFVVSSSAPILQKWFSSTDHPAAKDPYFLYGASNLGSMLALVGYPAFVEPNMILADQRKYWVIGYGLLMAITALCGWLMFQCKSPAQETSNSNSSSESSDVVDWKRRSWWVLLGAVPSSLMLGATTYMTTDIAAIPLLWVLPLGLYLLSFIIVFARVPSWVQTSMVMAMPMLVLLLVFMMLSDIRPPKVYWTVAIHLACLFVVAMVCHGELAKDRPSTKYLTEYFLWMSFGGVVGGLFNGLLAPIVFYGIVEYQLILMLACFMLPAMFKAKPNKWNNYADLSLALLFLVGGTVLIYLRTKDKDLDFELLKANHHWYWHASILAIFLAFGFYYILKQKENRLERALDIVLPLTLCYLTIGLIWGLFSDTLWVRVKSLADLVRLKPAQTLAILTYGVPTVLCYTFVERSFRFGLSVGAIILATGFNTLLDSSVSYQERSFFGVLKVERDRFFQRLVHGTTLHGKQFLDPDGHSIPLTYYHETGPIGQVMAAYSVPDKNGKYPNCAFIGLGTGTMASYANKGQHVTFYDIDPIVKRISFDNDKYFTFVEDAKKRGANVELVLGDARLTMERKQLSEDEKYKIVVVDAFSSDAIPIHLITVEALKMYLTKITPDGLICFHISNRYLDLRPVLANLAEAENLKAMYFSDDDETDPGKARSTWVVLARNNEAMEKLLTVEKLQPIRKQWETPLKELAGVSWEQGPGPGSFSLMLNGVLRGVDAPWAPVKARKDVGVWSDDYSNLLSVFMW